jgi:Spy/CpxP family protein refolding chaperone
LTELEEARDKIRTLEDENRELCSEFSRNYKRKASEMCADEETDEAEEAASAVAEEKHQLVSAAEEALRAAQLETAALAQMSFSMAGV